MKRLYVLFLFFSQVILLCQAANTDFDNINLKISFYESKVYKSSDDIKIKITIENNSLSPFSFDLSRDKYENISFNLVNLNGEPIEQSEFLTLLRSSERKSFYRSINILPGEQFSFVESLRKYKKIPVGVFALDVKFYPFVDSKNTAKFLKSNRLSLIIHQKKGGKEEASEAQIMNSIKNIIRDKKLSPDEVISYILESRKSQEKEKFFLYIDLESLYNSNNNERTLKNMSEGAKYRILAQYKDMIWSSNAGDFEEYLSKIPTDYSIIKTEYGKSNAKVTVIQKYEYKKYTEVKKFIYNLLKEENYWKLTSYSISVVS